MILYGYAITTRRSRTSNKACVSVIIVINVGVFRAIITGDLFQSEIRRVGNLLAVGRRVVSEPLFFRRAGNWILVRWSVSRREYFSFQFFQLQFSLFYLGPAQTSSHYTTLSKPSTAVVATPPHGPSAFSHRLPDLFYLFHTEPRYVGRVRLFLLQHHARLVPRPNGFFVDFLRETQTHHTRDFNTTSMTLLYVSVVGFNNNF